MSVADQKIDQVLVIVNDDVITESEFRAESRALVSEFRARGAPLPSQRIFNRRVLDKLIREKVLMQRAAERGIRVNDAEVDAAIEEIARSNGGNVVQLRERLAETGLDYGDFRSNLVTQLTIRNLVDREITRTIQVSDAEIDQYLESDTAAVDSATLEFDLSHILLALTGDESEAEVAAMVVRAQEIRAEIEAGLEFETAAARFSDSPDGVEGGKLGWRSEDQLPGLFVDALKRTTSGDITEVLRSPRGVHILKLNSRRGGTSNVITQYRVRHILLIPNVLSKEPEVRARLERLRSRILAGEEFEQIARLHSEDIGTRPKGGEMDWISPGDTVLEFEQAIESLKPGEISLPVQTRYGIHLIEVLESREVDVGDQQRRSEAARRLRARKIDERYEQWVNELRDQAFIEFRVTAEELE